MKRILTAKQQQKKETCSTLYRVEPNETLACSTAQAQRYTTCSTLYRVEPNETLAEWYTRPLVSPCSTLYRVEPNETDRTPG